MSSQDSGPGCDADGVWKSSWESKTARIQGQCDWRRNGWVVGFWQVSKSFQSISPHPTLLTQTPIASPVIEPFLSPSGQPAAQHPHPPGVLLHGHQRGMPAFSPLRAEPTRAWMVSAVHAVPPATRQPLWEVEKEVLNEQMLMKEVPPALCRGSAM